VNYKREKDRILPSIEAKLNNQHAPDFTGDVGRLTIFPDNLNQAHPSIFNSLI
jgi:hypothetical protein